MTDPSSQTRSVELAYPLERNGTRYVPDSTVTLPVEEAKQLVRDGRARWVADTTTKSTEDQNAGETGMGGVSGG